MSSTLPVKAVSAGVDAATTSQSEADEKRGRQIREEEERRGREARLMLERCRKGRPLPTDQCPAVALSMRYFLDTEFNGFGGALLSLALVPEDGEEFYVTLGLRRPAPSVGRAQRHALSSIMCRSGCVSPRVERREAADALVGLSGVGSRAGAGRRLARGFHSILLAADDRPGEMVAGRRR